MVQFPTGDGVFKLWHRRLDHLNVKDVHTLQNMISGINLGKFSCPTSSLLCEVCIEGNQHRATLLNEGGRRVTKPLEIIHSDVCGPIRTKFMGGARYFKIFIDDFSIKV